MTAWWNGSFPEMDALQRTLEHAFEDSGFPFRRRPGRVSFLPGLRTRAYPLLNVSEDPDAFYVEGLAPGVDPESINVTVAHNQLTLSGQKKGPDDETKPEAYHRNERAAGKFVRTVNLSTEVDNEGIKADYEDGLLRITLPKAEIAKAKRISVNVA